MLLIVSLLRRVTWLTGQPNYLAWRARAEQASCKCIERFVCILRKHLKVIYARVPNGSLRDLKHIWQSSVLIYHSELLKTKGWKSHRQSCKYFYCSVTLILQVLKLLQVLLQAFVLLCAFKLKQCYRWMCWAGKQPKRSPDVHSFAGMISVDPEACASCQ